LFSFAKLYNKITLTILKFPLVFVQQTLYSNRVGIYRKGGLQWQDLFTKCFMRAGPKPGINSLRSNATRWVFTIEAYNIDRPIRPQ